MSTFLKIIKKWLLEAVFPRWCLSCRKEGSYLCNTCLSNLKHFKKSDTCFWCKREKAVEEFGKCSKCYFRTPLSKVIALYDWEEKIIQKVLHYFASQGVYDIGGFLGKLMANKLREELGIRVLNMTIAPVPSHWWKKHKRGFNQAQKLAEGIAQELNIEIDNESLARIEKGSSQKGLTKEERFNNVRGKFKVTTGLFINKEVLLVDDVMASGATLHECAKELKKSGAKRVVGVVVAKR